MPDTKQLLRKYNTWFCRLAVPTDCRAALGGKLHMLRSLGTTDLRAAQRQRHAVIAEWQALFARIRAGRQGDEVAGTAVAFRQTLSDPARVKAFSTEGRIEDVHEAIDEHADALPPADADASRRW